jgi:hypothetical protein
MAPHVSLRPETSQLLMLTNLYTTIKFKSIVTVALNVIFAAKITELDEYNIFKKAL